MNSADALSGRSVPKTPQTWTLAFHDPELERAFARADALSSRNLYRLLWGSSIFINLLGLLVDRETMSSAANFRFMVFFRLVVITPVLVLVALLGWAKEPRYLRWQLRAIAAGYLAAIPGLYVAVLLVPDPGAYDPNIGPMGIAVVVVVGCAIAVRRFVVALFALVLPSLPLLLLSAGTFHMAGSVVVWTLLSLAVGLFLSWMVEQSRRATFLAERAVEREYQRSEGLLQDRLRELVTSARERDLERIDQLERKELELQAVNSELRRQVVERSRALVTSISPEAAPAAALPAEHEVFDGRYRVVRAIGRGGMGAVFEVARLADQKPFALKLMIGKIDADAATRFLREAELAARIHHANLVSVVDVGTSNTGALFLVMELVQGRTLEQLSGKWSDRAWALSVLSQVARGVEALHREQVVHRDLKPANMFLGTSGLPARLVEVLFRSLALRAQSRPLASELREALDEACGEAPAQPAVHA